MNSNENKANQIKTCVYCGGKANSEDHIPSRNLIQINDRDKIKFIKVDSCIKCNGGFSKDEEFFRNYIVIISQDYSRKAAILFDSTVRRSIERRRHIGKAIFRNMSLIDIYTPSGIYLGKKGKIEITEKDRPRIFNIMDKYVKGLAAHYFGTRVPNDHLIRHIWTDEDDPSFEDEKLLKTLILIKDDLGIFSYAYGKVENTFQSIWISIFFEKILFISFVYPANSKVAQVIPRNIISFRPKPF